MAKFEEFYYESSTGKNTIHAIKCVPEGEVRGVVQIAHGIAEHINRYEDFMRFLADNGLVCVGNDHLGHGKSIREDSEQGIFAEKDGWNFVLKDMLKLHDMTHEEYPDVKYIMFGHSMGSFLTRNYIINYPDSYDLAILSGTGHQSPLLIFGGCTISDLLSSKNGVASDGQKLEEIAFGSYCSKIENPRTPFDWLSVCEENVDKYIADPLCGFVAKTGLYRDMMHGIKFITKKKNIAKMNPDKPIYFMSGDADPVGDYGEGVKKAYKAFCNAGLKDVMIRLYPGGRHEMLNETNKEQVYQDILNWINSKL